MDVPYTQYSLQLRQRQAVCIPTADVYSVSTLGPRALSPCCEISWRTACIIAVRETGRGREYWIIHTWWSTSCGCLFGHASAQNVDSKLHSWMNRRDADDE